jgi:uncharacterized repeat protein (TIGR04076 family)
LAQEETISQVKITVLKRLDPQEIFTVLPVKVKPEFAVPCPRFTQGQEFIIDHPRIPIMPPEFCSVAWQSLWWPILSLMSNATFYQWYDEPNVLMAACVDGLRPVIFKLERIDK